MAPERLNTRFAPAPTGHLHLGHVVNALYVWGLGRRLGAHVVLRIEDHDRQRSRPAYEGQLLDDLDWLGFEPDHYPTRVFRAGPCASRQSDRHEVYAAAAADLAARGLLYGCTCSRETLIRNARAAGDRERTYPGTCRDRGVAPGPGVAWRVRLDQPQTAPVPDLLLPATDVAGGTGPGDPIVRDRLGNWTYTFAVVVDDFRQDIGLVIRGRDLAGATQTQVALGALIGRPTPARFAHHPLVMKSATEKLSKSDNDTGIVDLRRAGWSAPRLIGHAAHLVGITTVEAPVDASAVAGLFAVVTP